ncbi:hypothetical protein PHLCEN_2v2301 [Hermanssonia centrifuga]|uniref:Uncharacterized protein n=1 Tax=Hermanssonia centrifuga TaxID=98765 RepID=A0A2R6RPJ4_9APHY|nr:hypothetical protein PHLCEN_2v2301 [Hermanssonia centrifuga]
MNIAQVLVDTVPSLQISSPVTIIFLVLNPILISRFLLNLRQLDEPKNERQSRFNSQYSIPGFRVPTSTSIVGNMGAELDHGPAEEADNDSEDAGVESRNEASVNGAAENLPGAPFTADVLEVLEVPRDAI